MKKYIVSIFIIISMICFPHNTYANETIEIEHYDSFPNFYPAMIGDTDQLKFPQTLTIYSTDGQTYTESIIWDKSNIDWQKEGYYIIEGTISNANKYTNIPKLSIGLSLYEKYDMSLQVEEITHDSVTFSFQDAYHFIINHELDLQYLQVWACEAHQYNEDQNWYDVTDDPNVHLTSTNLTIHGLEGLYDTDLIYRIQISYDHPRYLKYSLSSHIMSLDDELFVTTFNSGDRNGGNREKRNEVNIPKEDNNNDSNHNQDVSIDVSTSTKNELNNDETQKVQSSSSQSTQSTSLNHKSQSLIVKQQEDVNIINEPLTTNNTHQETTQNENKERTISAKNIEIHSKPSLLMPLFIVIGIIVGLISIKKTYEEK